MVKVTQEWLSRHMELLGTLASCKEDLEDITEGAELDPIAEHIQSLQTAIEASNEEAMGLEDEEDEDEE